MRPRGVLCEHARGPLAGAAGLAVRVHRALHAGQQSHHRILPEPWHIRYVGRPLAAAMRKAGVATLEQVFGIKGGDYPH